jgi:hypothetical protein
LTEAEYGEVVSLGNLNDRWFGRTIGSKILCQFLPEEAGVGSDDTVFAAVISGWPLEDVNPNLLFGCRLWRFLDRALGDVPQKFAQSQGATELIARYHPFNERQSGVIWLVKRLRNISCTL